MAANMQASVAHMVAKLLARRATPQSEIAVLMRTVESALRALAAPPPLERERPPLAMPAPRPPRRRRARAEPIDAALPPPPSPPPPPQPRLVRRTEIAPVAPAPEGSALRPTQSGATLRGIVKRFDQRTRRGALQLPGCSEDIPIEPALLDDMGITRLYKWQEIEAVLSDDPRPRVLRLAIPGGVWQVHPTGGVVRNRNRARPVVVELKREALRRVAARVEAEHLLGPPARAETGLTAPLKQGPGRNARRLP